MAQNPHRPDSYGLVLALTIMLAVWLLNTRGLLRSVDDCFSDLTGLQSAGAFDPANLLLVYTEPATLESADGQLVELVRSIQDLQPSNIGIVHRVSEDQCEQLVKSGVSSDVVVGATIQDLATHNDDQRHLPRGYLDLWLKDQPVYRWHRAQVLREQTTFESLEARLVRARQGSEAGIPTGEFGVRYRGGASSLPHVDESSFSDGSIVPELVAGRFVLIGVAEEDGLGLVTPTTYGTDRMSRLELHGNILNTMLRDSAIGYANPLLALILLLAVATISSHLFRQSPSDWMLFSVLTCLAVVTGFCYLFTRLWSMQLPLCAMWLTCGLNFLGILRARFHTLAKFFQDWKLLRRTNLKTTRQQSYDEIWSSVARSASQLFHPERIVLLELETAATHLRVRELVGCDESDIVEKRRDISRSPFREALEQRCPVDIDFRPFLQRQDDTSQYMVPLVSGPDPQGIMVLEVRKSGIDNWSDFDDRLSEFADEMAAFLGSIRERDLERLLSNHALHRVRFLPERIVSRALFQDEVEHRDYEELLDRAIDCSQVPVAIYDVFGRLLKSNKKMIECLQDHDISVADTSCAEMLTALTDRSQENCRALVRRCMIDARSEEILLPPSGEGQAARILFVTPLRSIDSPADEGIEYRYISIQLIDSSIFSEIQQWHKGFVESHTGALRARLEQLHQLTQQLDDRCQTQSLSPYLQIAEEITDALEQCQTALAGGLGNRSENCFLTDIDPILSKAIAASAGECEVRGVQLRRDSTGTGLRAICNPALLRQVMVSILERLLHDITRHSVILIADDCDGDRVRIRFDIISLLHAATGEHDSTTRSQRVRDGKAALLVVDPHSQWISETSRLLKPWDACLRVECGTNYQLAVELELACERTANASAPTSPLSACRGEGDDA